MIKTENGNTTFRGTGSEIAADLAGIIHVAIESTPAPFLMALEVVCDELDERTQDTLTDRQKMLAAVLSQLPKEELEALKKKAEEGKHDGTNH